MLRMSRVFVSCGQDSTSEREAAAAIQKRLESLGFEVYVAIAAQSVEDINSGIIRSLKRADYYIFVDFRREPIEGGFRGSLFTNQELAIATFLSFERVLFFQQRGMKLEGLLRYSGSNAAIFDEPAELPVLIGTTMQARGWWSDYSRHLRATRLRITNESITYGEICGRFLYIDIENRRYDIAAFDTVARLMTIRFNRGLAAPSPIRSPLKVTGAPAYAQTIWPRDHGALDVLAVDADSPTRVYLNSALDVTPLPVLVEGVGSYIFEYAVLARDFPILRFAIDLSVTGSLATTTARLVDLEDAA
jgi:hypothetical protein